MGKYLKVFDKHADYEAYINGEEVVLPNVSVCKDEHNVAHYNPWVRDYSKEYLTFEIVENGTVTIKASNANIAKTISYSTDGGNTWTDLTTSTTEQSLGTFSAGNKIMLKGTNTTYGTSSYYNQFGGTAKYKVYGNIMSLLYGDDFDGQTTFPTESTYTFRSLSYQSTGLTDASNLVLPATTLARNCYYSMFDGCTNLTTAPELPATTLASSCYEQMFYGCTSLTTSPSILPATTLAVSCYRFMFQNCTSLTTAPNLPEATLANNCYGYMFSGCTSLNYIKAMFTTTPGTGYTRNWVNGVSATGTFVKNGYATWTTTGVNGIPTGWTVETEIPTDEYNPTETFTPQGYVIFTATDNNAYIGLSKKSTNQSMYISKDGSHWHVMNEGKSLKFDSSKTYYVCGNLTSGNSSSDYTQFMMLGQISASGNVNSLWNYSNLSAELKGYCGYNMFQDCTSLTVAPSLPATTLAQYCYCQMFSGCTGLTTAPNLPATTLAVECYQSMFQGCTSLTTAPSLPATTLANNCYSYMFLGCTSLTTAPSLPATTLAQYCYFYMFSGCTSLTAAPELPATILANYCYREMFNGCTSLTAAPELPATTLVNYCYDNMFNGCTSLTAAPELPATTLAQNCYYYMFDGCTSLTTAPELPATTLVKNCYLGMFRDCTSLTTAPELPATTLVQSCYSAMFDGCTNLNYIKAMFTTTPGMIYTSNWVSSVASTGTFVKNSAATWDVTGADGIPTGWTVETASA